MVTLYIVLIVGTIGVGLMIYAFANPVAYVRFGKLIIRIIKHAFGKPTSTPEQEESKAKAKKLAPYMSIANRIEQIVPGQIMRFKIPELWGGDFISVELDPHFQQEKNYIIRVESAVDGLPGGESTVMYSSDKPIVIAASIMDRSGQLFVEAGEKQERTDKVAAHVIKQVAPHGKGTNTV